MSQYTPVTNFLSKDSLVSGNSLKAVKGAELSTEFAAVQTAVNSKPDGSSSFFPDGSNTQPSIGFTNNAGTGMYNVAGALDFATGGTLRLSIAASGAITAATAINANGGIVGNLTGNVGGGTVNSTTGVFSGLLTANGHVLISGSSGSNNAELDITNTDSSGGAWRIGDAIAAAAGTLAFYNTTNARNTLQIAGTGNVTIPAPTTGTTLALSSVAGVGLTIDSGPVYAGIPQNLQVGSTYTFVLSDANKHIAQGAGGAHTYTIPANSSVAFPIGTAITLINEIGAGNLTLNITTDQLTWCPSGATGSRTLAAGAVATLLKITSTAWYMTGVGIT